MRVKIELRHKDAKTPTRGTNNSAGWDFYAADLPKIVRFDDYEIQYVEYDTGVAVEIPAGYVGLCFPRSSISTKGLSMANCVGVIDSDYRGTVKARFRLTKDFRLVSEGDGDRYTYAPGDRIFQMIILPYPEIAWEVVPSLSETDRGSGGWGSTGK